MEEVKKCPTCHTEVRSTDYFCFNCGANLKPKPPSFDIASQLTLYIKSLLLPPLGIYWAIPYLKQDSSKSKAVGILAIAITLVMLILTIVWTKQFVDNLNTQLNKQMTTFGY